MSEHPVVACCSSTRTISRRVLLAREGADTILVVGIGGSSRGRGAVTGSVATALAHRAVGPVLPARESGAEPMIDVLRGARVGVQVSDIARRYGSSLPVVGRGSVSGLRALGSVSECLVRTAPCSVLLVPHPAAIQRQQLR